MEVGFEKGGKISATIYNGDSKKKAELVYRDFDERRRLGVPVPLYNSEFNIRITDVTHKKKIDVFDTGKIFYKIVLKGVLV